MRLITPLLSFLLLVFGSTLLAQIDPIQNIAWDITDTKMVITYDLISPDGVNRRYDIELTVELADEKRTPTQGVTGIQSVPVGKERIINWFYGRNGLSMEDLESDNVKVSLKAINPNPPIDFSVPSQKGKGSSFKKPSIIPGILVSAAGLGTFAVGLGMESSARKIYENYYELYKCEGGGSFSLSCWEDTYNSANGKHKNAQIAMIGGGVLIAAGVFLIQNRNRKVKNLSLVPDVQYAPYIGNLSGITLQYSF